MQLLKKVKITLTVLILLMSIATSSIYLATVNAQTSPPLKTYAFVGATPNPVGVGQQTVLRLGITQQLAAPAYGWVGLTITITHPDGKKENLGPFRTDSTGGTYSIYIPTEEGNYTLQSHFPQQTNPGIFEQKVYLETVTAFFAGFVINFAEKIQSNYWFSVVFLC